MKYGLIPASVKTNTDVYRLYIDKYKEAGVSDDKIVVVSKPEEVLKSLQTGDWLVCWQIYTFYDRTDDLFRLLEHLLSSGITFYHLGCEGIRGSCIIRPEELVGLQCVVKMFDNLKNFQKEEKTEME